LAEDKVERTVEFDLATVPIGEHFKITPQGLHIRGKPSFDAFASLGEMLRTFERVLQFTIGDWINALEDRYGEQASQLIDASGWAESTIKTYAWTAKKVPKENRMIDQGLSYAHHQLVGALPPAEQRQWLKQALGDEETGIWTTARLRSAVKDGSDLAPTKWWVMVECRDEKDQAALLKKLELDGRQCKALAKRAGE
jgi:hypothetical protein